MTSKTSSLAAIWLAALVGLPAAARPHRAASTEARQAASAASALAQERRLGQAKKSLTKLTKDKKRRRFRDAWVSIIRELEAVARSNPSGPKAAEARLHAARAREELWRASRVKPDGKAAVAAYRKVDEGAPGTATAAQALSLAAALSDRLGWKTELASICRRLSGRYASSGMPADSACDRAQPARAVGLGSVAAGGGVARRGGVVVDAALPVAAPPAGRPIDPDAEDDDEVAAPAAGASRSVAAAAKDIVAPKAVIAPQAVIADAVPPTPSKPVSAKAAARAGRDAPATPHKEADSDTSREQSEDLRLLVHSARAASATEPGKPVVEQDEAAPAAEEAEALHEPDAPKVLEAAARGVEAAAREIEAVAVPTEGDDAPAPERAEVARQMRKAMLATDAVPLAAQLGLKIRRVVIDAGHGGKDTGAIGPHGVREKDVALAIARRLEKRLRALGLEVVQTRSDDRTVALDERTRIANRAKADLFVSIHCNAAKRRKVSGIETWTLNVASGRYAARLAAFENAGSPLRQSDLRIILKDLAKKADTTEARDLARAVQGQLVRTVRSRVGAVRDHGVKQALFYVLLGTEMPSILVETAFLSNPAEEARLKSAKYQEATAEAIARGVKDFLDGRQRIARASVP